jgi:hypothetical protein
VSSASGDEARYLAARCRLVLDALEDSQPEFREMAAAFRAVIDRELARSNARGLRTIRRDLLEMAQTLGPGARTRLQASLDRQEADDPFRGAAG